MTGSDTKTTCQKPIEQSITRNASDEGQNMRKTRTKMRLTGRIAHSKLAQYRELTGMISYDFVNQLGKG